MGIVNRDNALYMATGIDNSGLKDDANSATSIIDDLTKRTESSGDQMQKAFDKASAASDSWLKKISAQKTVITELEKQYTKTKEQLSSFDFGSNNAKGIEEYEKAKNLLDEVNIELDEARANLGFLEASQKKYAQAVADTVKAVQNSANTNNTASWNDTVTTIPSLAGAIEFQKNHIKTLYADLDKTKLSAKELAGIIASIQSESPHKQQKQAEYDELTAKARELAATIKDEEAGLSSLNKSYEKLKSTQEKRAFQEETASKKQLSTLTQMRNIREEMAGLTNADGSVSPQNLQRYDELRNKLSEVGTAYRRVQQEQRLLTTAGNAQLAGMIQGVTALSGTFTAFQGISSLVIKNDERLAEIQTKLQAAMSITMGWQAASNALHATSNLRIVTLTKATELWTSANYSLGKSFIKMGISANVAKVASAGLLSLGIGALVIGIGVLINKHKEWNKRQEETKRINKIVTDSLKEASLEGAKSAQKETLTLNILYKASQNDKKSKEERTKAVKEMQRLYPSYFGNLSKEEILAGKGADAYDRLTKSIIASAKARAASDKIKENESQIIDLKEKIKDENEKQEKLNTKLGKLGKKSSGLFINQTKKSLDTAAKENINDEIEKSSKQIFEHAKEIAKRKEANDRLAEIVSVNDLLFDGKNHEKGSKDYWQSIREENQRAMDAAIPDSSTFSKAKAARDKADKELEKWNKTNFNKEANAAEKGLEAKRKLDESDEKRQLDKLKFDYDMRQREIDLLDDSFEKRIKQIKLNYERESQATKEFEQKILKEQVDYAKNKYISNHGSSKGFEAYYSKLSDKDLSGLLPEGLRPEDVQAQIKEMTDAARKEQEKGMKDINRDLSLMLQEQNLMFASDLEKKLADLDNYYNEQRKKAGDNAQLIEQIESNRKRAKQEAIIGYRISKIDFDEQLKMERLAGMESIGMTELVEEKKLEITRQYIQLRIDALKPLVNNGDEEAIKQTKLLEASLKKLDLQKPAKSLKGLADDALFKVIQKGFERSIKASGKYGDSLEDTKKIAGEAEEKTIGLFNKFSKEGSQILEVVNLMQSAFGGLDESLDLALDTVGTIASGFAQGGLIGGAIAAVSAGINLMSKASEAEKRHQQALKDIANSRIAQQRQYNLLLLEQNLLLEEAATIFGVQQIYKATKAIDVYRDALGQLQKEIRGEKPVFNKPKNPYDTEKSFKQYQKQLEAYEKGVGRLSSAEIVTGHKKTGMFGWGKGKDTYTSILDVERYKGLVEENGQLNKSMLQTIIATEKMSDETKAYLQHLSDLQEQAEAAQEALRDYLKTTFGSLGDDLMSSLENAIKNRGINAWKEFGKFGAKVIEELGNQLTYQLFFAKRFEDLQKDIEKVYGSGKEDDEIARDTMKLVGEFYQNIGSQMDLAQGFMENWKKEAEKYGLELWAPEKNSQSSSHGGFETMTQDQAGEMNGRLTGMHETDRNIENNTLQLILLASDRNQMLRGTSENVLAIRNVIVQSMFYLEEIRDSNNELYEIKEILNAVKKNTSSLTKK